LHAFLELKQLFLLNNDLSSKEGEGNLILPKNTGIVAEKSDGGLFIFVF
jgi:hypothetical protein